MHIWMHTFKCCIAALEVRDRADRAKAVMWMPRGRGWNMLYRSRQ